MKRQIQFFSGLAFSTIAALSWAPSAHAIPAGAESEVILTQATIDYQSKNYSGCKKALRELLNSDPDNVGALELLALSQRASNEDDAASGTYEHLISKGPKEKRAAYSFELGTIHYKKKDTAKARKYFDIAASAKFNPGTSNFFLGVLDFNAKEWRNARNHLTASLTYSDGDTMAPITRYYLANTYAQLGKSDAAIQNYYAAEKSVEEKAATSTTGIDQLSDGIRKNALKELKALDKGQQYLSLTYMNQFDSNVQTNPSEVDNAVASSSQRSGKSILSVATGLSTSPTKTLQITPSFSYYTNYNYNFLARNFNFMTFTPALYMLYKPYARLSGGIKADGVFSMQNMLDPNESQRDLKYRPFSLTGDVGPVLKYELTPRVILGGELYWRPKRYYLDPATGTSRRSGGGIFGKASAEVVTPFWWFNPLMYFSYEWDHPAGTDFRMYAAGGGISNSVPVNDRLTLTGTFDMVSTDYNQTVPKRDDVNLNFRVSGSYVINAHWTALADAGYTVNQSTLETLYKYERFTTSAGATYSF